MMKTTLSTPYAKFQLIPASELRHSLEAIPASPGVYIWLVRNGRQLLQLSSYFETDTRSPIACEEYMHLYTGSANDLRFRLTSHVRSDKVENSSPRKSLLALEHVFGALTEIYGISYGSLENGGLTDWIFDNVVFGYEVHNKPLYREAAIIGSLVSPFNIAHRRQHRYSKYLMAWRAIAFPSNWMESIPLQPRSSELPLVTAKQRRALISAVSVK